MTDDVENADATEEAAAAAAHDEDSAYAGGVLPTDIASSGSSDPNSSPTVIRKDTSTVLSFKPPLPNARKAPSSEESRRKMEEASAKAAEMAAKLGDSEEDEAEDLGAEAAAEMVRNGSSQDNMVSFVGFYTDDSGQALSNHRIFSSSGESHGVSRSIGDRGAARAGVMSHARHPPPVHVHWALDSTDST